MDVDVNDFIEENNNNVNNASNYNNVFNDMQMNNNNFNNNNNNNIDDDVNFILCPMCQTPIKPNAANLCIKCLNSQYDIAAGISKEIIIYQCRQCSRWYKNPQWISAELESTILLEILLKKIRGLGGKYKGIKLINAQFVWTEPHSRRIKIKLTIQKEVLNNCIVEKSFLIEYIIENQQCKDCQLSFTHTTWKSCIQLRQKVSHKRTFLFIEQLILKHNMASNCMGIKELRDGIDFFFSSKQASQSFLAWLHCNILINSKTHSKRLTSHDHKSNIANFKYTIYAELSPICRNDLCLIPLKLQKKCGGYSPLMICYKVTTTLHLLEPTSLHTIELDAKQYWRYYFKSISAVSHLSCFYVMRLIPIKTLRRGKWRGCELELVRENDLGDNNASILETVCHLGGILKEGDMVLGYDLNTLSTHNDLYNNKNLKNYLKKSKIPDVIVIKKYYPYSNKSRKRKWKLKSIVKDRDYNVDKYAAEKEKIDNELFMRDIEQDFDLRCRINVYKDKNINNNNNNDADVDDAPNIPDNELIDEFNDMKISSDNNINGNNIDNNNNNDDNDQQMINID